MYHHVHRNDTFPEDEEEEEEELEDFCLPSNQCLIDLNKRQRLLQLTTTFTTNAGIAHGVSTLLHDLRAITLGPLASS